ncbi:MAG: Minf_1886 family protein [Candidatus Brocadiales bacterium]
MSKKSTFKTWLDKLHNLTQKDRRYPLPAYQFVFEALDYTVHRLKKNLSSSLEGERHVTGQELLEGIEEYALDQFGYMAKTVFEQWGTVRGEDFGEIVFNLVESGLMGKTESDTKNDFDVSYDFQKTLEEHFRFSGKFDISLRLDDFLKARYK